MRRLLFVLGMLVLLAAEILRVYWIMPFPGSQENVPTDTFQVDAAYFLHHYRWWLRGIGAAIAIVPFLHFMRSPRRRTRITALAVVLFYALVLYAFNFKFMADQMFIPPMVKRMAPPVVTDSTRNSLVVVVEHDGEARAYPIELIGYHHQVPDTVGGEPVLVTYCTVCRTGRVWKPEVDGRPETFRLVGMDHFNAMFEDSRTKSWWRQVTGECIEGPLKGRQLEEVFSQQMTLEEFASLHPHGLVFQPDPNFMEKYAGLKGFDDGTIESSLEYRDTASWQPKSWVVGMVHNGQARAYDWNDLFLLGEILDTLGGDSIVVMMTGDADIDFRVSHYHPHWVDEEISPFLLQPDTFYAVKSSFFQEGERLPAYQEFWHSWRTFHPNTTRYAPKQ